MKFVLDALGAPASSGGMRLYADGVIRGWVQAQPDDILTIVGAKWLSEEFADHASVRVVHWPNDSAVTRIFGQFFVTAAVMWWTRSAAIISLSPIVTPMVGRRRRVCVVQDWRHIKNPHEFGRAQLAYRKFWESSVSRAGAVVTMSQKTQAETQELVPSARSSVVETGRDYVRYWPVDEDVPRSIKDLDGSRLILTFGHHSNKRPDLLIDALGMLDRSLLPSICLVVLGARGPYQEKLRALAIERGVLDYCRFPGFVEEAEYRRLVRSASLIALVSSDEGFGLPVAEANYLGIPALVTTDSGLDEIHESGIVVAEPNPASVARAITKAIENDVQMPGRGALTTWSDTAFGIRRSAVGALRGDDTTF